MVGIWKTVSIVVAFRFVAIEDCEMVGGGPCILFLFLTRSWDVIRGEDLRDPTMFASINFIHRALIFLDYTCIILIGYLLANFEIKL